MRTYELARKYGLTIQGAVTWAFEFEDQPTFVPLRALATNGVDKPVLNAFRLMGMLSAGKPGGSWLAAASSGALPVDQIVTNSVTAAPDVNAVATRNGREVDVLVWNYHDADVEAPPAEVHLQVDGLQARAVIASEFSVDATHSNAYRVWQKMGSPAQLTEEQQGLLGKAAQLEQPDPERIMPVTSGNAELNLTVPRQAVVLVRLLER
jgi:xylan 1,4-beta-xylosidase